jgi:hypothetical protein
MSTTGNLIGFAVSVFLCFVWGIPAFFTDKGGIASIVAGILAFIFLFNLLSG